MHTLVDTNTHRQTHTYTRHSYKLQNMRRPADKHRYIQIHTDMQTDIHIANPGRHTNTHTQVYARM